MYKAGLGRKFINNNTNKFRKNILKMSHQSENYLRIVALSIITCLDRI